MRLKGLSLFHCQTKFRSGNLLPGTRCLSRVCHVIALISVFDHMRSWGPKSNGDLHNVRRILLVGQQARVSETVRDSGLQQGDGHGTSRTLVALGMVFQGIKEHMHRDIAYRLISRKREHFCTFIRSARRIIRYCRSVPRNVETV